MSDKTETIDTSNDHLVATQAGGILIMLPPRTRMAKAEALRMAAWIVILAEEDEGEFNSVLEAIKGT